MNNMFLYYNYVVKPQLLLKFPGLNCNKLQKFDIVRVMFKLSFKEMKKSDYIYLYNLGLLVRLLLDKNWFIYKLDKSMKITKCFFQINLEKESMFLFLDVFTTLLLPMFQMYNLYLYSADFDDFGNFFYKFYYFDPIFISKNIVTAWLPENKVIIFFNFSVNDIEANFVMLQYFNLQYYYITKEKTYNNDLEDFTADDFWV